MLYYLFRYLGQYGVTGANLWHYISFRAILTLVLSLLISMWFGEHFIRWMKKHHGNEAQRDASIDPYGVEKKDVPTMGGIIFVGAFLVGTVVFAAVYPSFWIVPVMTFGFGLIGWLDDFIEKNYR